MPQRETRVSGRATRGGDPERIKFHSGERCLSKVFQQPMRHSRWGVLLTRYAMALPSRHIGCLEEIETRHQSGKRAPRMCGSRLPQKLMRHGTRKGAQRIFTTLAKGRATSDVTTMSAETKEWLVEVAFVMLAAIALIHARGAPVEHVDSNDAPLASVRSNN